MSGSGIKGVVPIDKMASEITKALTNWSQEVADAMNAAVAEATAYAVLDLKRNSPKDSGDYAKDWTRTTLEKSRYALRNVVHNKGHYRLTHLLEHGHAIVNAKKPGAKTRTDAYPHIGLAEAHAQQILNEKMEQYIHDID